MMMTGKLVSRRVRVPITYLPPFWERQDDYMQHMLTNKLPEQGQEAASKIHKRNSKKHFTYAYYKHVSYRCA